MSVAERLSRFATAPVAEAGAALEMARLSLFDWAVCAWAGQGEPVARILRAQAVREGGEAVASLVGGGQVPARAAALVNGTISHALDYDDTHFAHIGHPSVVIFPAVLALAERRRAAVLEAALVGTEASVRVGRWLGRSHYQAGFHMTATAGAIGAALAGARVLGLDHERTGHALGLAAGRAAGLKSQFGTMGKPFNAGQAAEAGVLAAVLAAGGFRSRPEALDGPQGLAATHHGAGDLDAFDGLGEDWEILTISHKFHACCHGLHAMLEAAASLPQGPFAALTVKTHPRWLSVCNIAAPATGLEAKFSYRLAAALALSGQDTAALATWSDANAADRDLTDQRDRVTVVADPGLSEQQARLALTTFGGVSHRAAHDLAAPLDVPVRAARLRRKGRALMGDDRAGRLWDVTQQRAPDPGALWQILGQPQEA